MKDQEAPFKIGDRVIVESVDNPSKKKYIGNVVRVTNIFDDFLLETYTDDGINLDYMYSYRFRRKHYEVGDKVRVKPNGTGYPGVVKGAEYVGYISEKSDYYQVLADRSMCLTSKTYMGLYSDDELEFLPDAPKQMMLESNLEFNYLPKYVPGEFAKFYAYDEAQNMSTYNITIKGDTNMSTTKFYKVIKETPRLLTGAILEASAGSDFRPISDLWNIQPDDVVVIAHEVEKTPKFYERVYAAQVDGRTVYVDKKTARSLLEESFTLKTAKTEKETK